MAEKLKKRSEIDEKFKWKINDLVSSNEEFEKEYSTISSNIKKIEEFKSNLNKSNLYECLKLRDNLSNNVIKLYVFANLKSNEDSTNNFYQAMASKAETLISEYQSSISFLEPEILNLDKQEILCEMETNNNLKIYKHYIEDLFRTKNHILSLEKEEILAKTYELLQIPDNIYSMINDADIKFEDFTDEKGNIYKLTHGNYISYLENENQNIRKNAFKAYYKSYEYLKNTIATTYISSVKADAFIAKARNYNSSLEKALFEINVPTQVYKNLIKTVHKYLPTMHKYISARKKILKLDEIHFYDLYTPLVKNTKKEITFEQSKQTVLKALAPLGEYYTKIVDEAFKNGWIDIYENVGKRSGAYVWGAYGCHPFMSLNYKNNLNNMFTLAHEMGHALHSYLTQENQPYIYGNYTIFLAEVASTVNEALLMEYLLKETTDESEKKYLINYFIEQFRTTLFRQTMFAEFEMIVHEEIEKGNPQTFESLCEIYKNLNIKYYGKEIVLDKEIEYEWTRIPHFYNAFYVYQYATGYSCAISFAKKILEQNGAEKYLQFLKSGSCDYSLEILKKSGVDISQPQPIDDALKLFETLVEKMDKF